MRRARINFLGQIPGSTRLYVPDLNGRLYTEPAGGGTPSVYLDVKAVVGSNFFSGKGMGSGFGFVAFHPDFAANGRFYTVHSEAFDALNSQRPDWTEPDAVVQSVVTEWTATNPAPTTACCTSRSATAASATRRPCRRTGPCRTARSCASTRAAPTAPTATTEFRPTTRSSASPARWGRS